MFYNLHQLIKVIIRKVINNMENYAKSVKLLNWKTNEQQFTLKIALLFDI